jgi:hypothetical protein
VQTFGNYRKKIIDGWILALVSFSSQDLPLMSPCEILIELSYLFYSSCPISLCNRCYGELRSIYHRFVWFPILSSLYRWTCMGGIRSAAHLCDCIQLRLHYYRYLLIGECFGWMYFAEFDLERLFHLLMDRFFSTEKKYRKEELPNCWTFSVAFSISTCACNTCM